MSIEYGYFDQSISLAPWEIRVYDQNLSDLTCENVRDPAFLGQKSQFRIIQDLHNSPLPSLDS